MNMTTKTARLCLLIIAIIALAGMAQAQKIPKSKPPKAEGGGPKKLDNVLSSETDPNRRI